MLELKVSSGRVYNEDTCELIEVEGRTLRLEHSLRSIQEWEAKYKRSFLDDLQQKNLEEIYDYISMMSLDGPVEIDFIRSLPSEHVSRITSYIHDPMTATTFMSSGGGQKTERITAELIYYWMVAHQIPQEYAGWHINQLLTLIRVCEIKSQPQKKVPLNSIYAQNKALNEKRRAMFNSKG